MKMGVIEWLLDSDPSIRWQVMRDLIGESDATAAGERSRVAAEGWGARLLDLQGPDGHWGGAAFVPHAWILPRTRSSFCESRCGPDERSSAKGHRPGARPLHLGRRVQQLAVLRRRGRALYQRTGACDRCVFRRGKRPARRSTPSGAVERRRLELRRTAQPAVVIQFDDLRARRIAGVREGEGSGARRHRRSPSRTGVFLERRLFRSQSTGQIIKQEWTEISFPTRWHYDILWGLDYLRRSGAPPDERMAEAIDLVRKKRNDHGRWPLENPHPGPVHFEMEGRAGEPSRWNTLRALRVLRWANAT